MNGLTPRPSVMFRRGKRRQWYDTSARCQTWRWVQISISLLYGAPRHQGHQSASEQRLCRIADTSTECFADRGREPYDAHMAGLPLLRVGLEGLRCCRLFDAVDD